MPFLPFHEAIVILYSELQIWLILCLIAKYVVIRSYALIFLFYADAANSLVCSDGEGFENHGTYKRPVRQCCGPERLRSQQSVEGKIDWFSLEVRKADTDCAAA